MPFARKISPPRHLPDLEGADGDLSGRLAEAICVCAICAGEFNHLVDRLLQLLEQEPLKGENGSERLRTDFRDVQMAKGQGAPAVESPRIPHQRGGGIGRFSIQLD